MITGNLLAAVRGIYEPQVYILVLRPDAKRHNKTGWFLFAAGAPPGLRGGGPFTVT